MTTYTRAQWGARLPRDTTPMIVADVVGIAFHWPAMSKQVRGRDAVFHLLQNIQNYHMDTHGWDDIAYQVAVDQDGNVYELRGLKTRSAANGDTGPNRQFGAVLLILATGEQPTTAMIETVRGQVTRQRTLFPKSTQLKGHGQVRPEPTACPGPAVQAAINAGKFEPIMARKTPLITAFRLATTNAERRTVAQQIVDGPNEKAGAQARAFLSADNARMAATSDKAAAAKSLLAQEVK